MIVNFILLGVYNKYMLSLEDLNKTQKNILFALSQEDMSPKQLAKKLEKTISYVSQQLKILYIGGYITEKETRSGKGSRKNKDVRSLYSLKKEIIKITAILKNNSKEIEMPNKETTRLFINCFGSTVKKPNYILKLYFNNYELIQNIINLYYLEEGKEVELLVITDKLELYRDENSLVKMNYAEKEITFRFWSHTPHELRKGVNNKEKYYLQKVNMAKPLIIRNQSLHKEIFHEQTT